MLISEKYPQNPDIFTTFKLKQNYLKNSSAVSITGVKFITGNVDFKLLNKGLKRKRRSRAKCPNGRSLSWFHYHEAPRSIATPPGQDASPSQGYPAALCCRYPFIHLVEERQNGVKFLV